ncbi:hypothetical protein IE53DRAFT_279353 [Violaceomyces palustris]|uniref:Uncharacterized protein n=1 Tax=Violaceomyces palustris TaxID=1673888 RepID=A0ACD0NMI4_9BASI|nr:hypothetical protein IE53DRAFT_279353 [Violaceomyces palustris]
MSLEILQTTGRQETFWDDIQVFENGLLLLRCLQADGNAGSHALDEQSLEACLTVLKARAERRRFPIRLARIFQDLVGKWKTSKAQHSPPTTCSDAALGLCFESERSVAESVGHSPSGFPVASQTTPTTRSSISQNPLTPDRACFPSPFKFEAGSKDHGVEVHVQRLRASFNLSSLCHPNPFQFQEAYQRPLTAIPSADQVAASCMNPMACQQQQPPPLSFEAGHYPSTILGGAESQRSGAEESHIHPWEQQQSNGPSDQQVLFEGQHPSCHYFKQSTVDQKITLSSEGGGAEGVRQGQQSYFAYHEICRKPPVPPTRLDEEPTGATQERLIRIRESSSGDCIDAFPQWQDGSLGRSPLRSPDELQRGRVWGKLGLGLGRQPPTGFQQALPETQDGAG